MALFDRVIQVQVAGRALPEQLRVSFDIVKSIDSVLNSASISIYNLSEMSRNGIRELNDVIVLNAGYKEAGGPKLVFKGNVLRVNHSMSLPDIVSKIEGGDGFKAISSARQSVSYEAGTSAQTVLSDVAKNMGLTVREIPTIDGEFLQGYSNIGAVKDSLSSLCARAKCLWSVQNDELQIIKDNQASVQAPVAIRRVEGLLEKLEKLGDVRKFLPDSEAVEDAGYRFRTLMNGDLIPGKIVTLTEYQGRFRIQRVQHQGDNYEGDFISICEVKEI